MDNAERPPAWVMLGEAVPLSGLLPFAVRLSCCAFHSGL